MMKGPMNKAAPYKTEPQPPKTKYEVLENGDVKITQEVTTLSFWKAREYLSLLRQNEEALKNTIYNYSDEFVVKMKEQEAQITEEINLMKPVMAEAEKLTRIDYEKQRHEGLKSNVIKAVEDKEINQAWWQNVWLRTKPEIRKPIIDELTEEQRTKLSKVIMKLKRKNIQ